MFVFLILMFLSPFVAIGYMVNLSVKQKDYNPDSRGPRCIKCGKFYDECGWCGTNKLVNVIAVEK